MVNFYVGINRYTFKGGSEEIQEKVVKDLNQILGSKKCPLHPNQTYDVGVDILSDGKIQFSSMKPNGCNFVEGLLETDVFPILDKWQIFPLPIQ